MCVVFVLQYNVMYCRLQTCLPSFGCSVGVDTFAFFRRGSFVFAFSSFFFSVFLTALSVFRVSSSYDVLTIPSNSSKLKDILEKTSTLPFLNKQNNVNMLSNLWGSIYIRKYNIMSQIAFK